MTTIRYRAIAEHELEPAAAVFSAANLDLQRRSGVAEPQVDDIAKTVRRYEHVYRTGIFHVAEVDGQIAGIACAVVREHLWFLAGFWVRPEFQRQRIGGPLLREVYEAGRRAGATIFFVWASNDPTAMASYMKLGMLPGSQIMKFAGTPLVVDVDGGLELVPLQVEVAAAIDREVRGVGREQDHQYWLGEPGYAGWQVIRGGRPVAYFYLNGGTVGSAGWLDAADAQPVMRLVLSEAAKAGEVRLNCTGDNHAAIRTALGAGLRFTGHSHFLTTAPFGKLDQYLISGPLLF